MTRLTLAIGLLFTLVVAGSVYLFPRYFEEVPEEKWVGPSPTARANPLLAAERFLHAMGIPVQAVDDLQRFDDLPPVRDVLLITTERLTLSQRHYHELLDWVRAGGHLIVRSRDTEWNPNSEDWELRGGPDPLLDRLGLEVDYGDYREGPVDVSLQDLDGTLVVDFDEWIGLTGAQDTDRVISDDGRTHLVHRSLGAGAVSVLGPMGFMTNWSIGDLDHAAFLWTLVNLHHEPGTVWVVHFDEMPALPVWLWNKAPLVLLTLALLFAAWLMAVTRRFGPLQPPPPPTRRRLLEHVEAAGHFLWRQGRQQALVADVRRALDARMCQLHPGWSELSAEERQRHLAQLTELPPQQIHELLHRQDHAHPQDFTRLIKTLETIRKQL